jgi:hypothetical protein
VVTRSTRHPPVGLSIVIIGPPPVSLFPAYFEIWCRTDTLVIIDNLHVMRPVCLPDKTDSPLIVDPYAVLALAVSLQRLQLIPRWNAKVFQTSGCIQLIQLSQRNGSHVAPQSAFSRSEENVCVFALEALEGLDHELII